MYEPSYHQFIQNLQTKKEKKFHLYTHCMLLLFITAALNFIIF